MYLIKKNIFYLFIFSVLLLSSCTEEIVFELNSGENNRLVVEGGITDEFKIHEIRLSRTMSYYTDQTVPAELGAKISVSSKDTIILFEDSDNDGIYKTTDSVAGIPETDYTLNIILSDKTEYYSNAKMNKVASLDSITYKREGFFDFQNQDSIYFYIIQLYAKEPATPGDYYLWKYYMDDKLVTDTLFEQVFVDDANVNGNDIFAFDLFYIEEDKIENDTVEITVSMENISKAQFDHHVSLMRETVWKGGPFEGPAANVPTNIGNGALGLFYANSVSQTKTTLIKTKK